MPGKRRHSICLPRKRCSRRKKSPMPSVAPSYQASHDDSPMPSVAPSYQASHDDSPMPSVAPSYQASHDDSPMPSVAPSYQAPHDDSPMPSVAPSYQASHDDSPMPLVLESLEPSSQAPYVTTAMPSVETSSQTVTPTTKCRRRRRSLCLPRKRCSRRGKSTMPSDEPSFQTSHAHSPVPSVEPSSQAHSPVPSVEPSSQATHAHSPLPLVEPSSQASHAHSPVPSVEPSSHAHSPLPSVEPSSQAPHDHSPLPSVEPSSQASHAHSPVTPTTKCRRRRRSLCLPRKRCSRRRKSPMPSVEPSSQASHAHSPVPSVEPSSQAHSPVPSVEPSSRASHAHSPVLSVEPSSRASHAHSPVPSVEPSSQASHAHSPVLSVEPSSRASHAHSPVLSVEPSSRASHAHSPVPLVEPSSQASHAHSPVPSVEPGSQASHVFSAQATPLDNCAFILTDAESADVCGTAAQNVRLYEEAGEVTDIDGHSAHQFFVIDESGVFEYSHTEHCDDVLMKNSEMLFVKLLACLRATSLPQDFVIVKFSTEEIVICDHYIRDGHLTVKMSVVLYPSQEFKVLIHRREAKLPSSAPSFNMNVQSVVDILNYLLTLTVCIGNPDEDMQPLIPAVGAALSSGKGPIIGYKEGDFGAYCGNLSYNSTIRHVECTMLVKGARCIKCQQLRHTLRCRRAHRKRTTETPPSRKTYAHMSPEEYRFKCGQLTQDKRRLSRKLSAVAQRVSDLEMALRQVIVREGERLSPQQNEEMNSLVEDSALEFEKAFPENSFQRCFWEEQMRYNRLNSKCGMRWHPLIIRWCLYIRSKSSKAYDGLRHFLNLPSQRTLYDYTHYTEHGTGFQEKVTEQFATECEKTRDDESSQYVGIVFDEIKIKSDLVYDKHTGELVGYVDLDKVGNELLNLQNSLNDSGHAVAKFLLVVMVRGVTTGLKYPLATFATDGIKSAFIYPVIWEAIEIVEMDAEMKVLFLCCDGATPNRKFFKVHDQLNPHLYRIENPFVEDDRYIYFVSDPPHLLKTARNCFSNSFSHRRSRTLRNNNKYISWMHIVNLYQDHCEGKMFRLCPKLSRQHIDLTAFSAMKVNLAAQVFSKTVGSALSFAYGDAVEETAKFVLLLNRWFDMMNTKNLNEGRQKRNPDLEPFTDINDIRLQWLENDFLQYFDEWERYVNALPNLSKKARSQMLLSKQTLSGLRFTTHSMVECIRFLITNGARFVLTSHFNQDALEQHFGHCRHKGGASENPTVFEACHILNQIRTVNAEGLAPLHGNVTRRFDVAQQLLDPTPLPKRQNRRY